MKKENVKVVKGHEYPHIDIRINATCQNYFIQPKVWHTEDMCELTVCSQSTGEVLLAGTFIQNHFYPSYIENTVQTIVSNDEPITNDDYKETVRLYRLIQDTTQREKRPIVFIP